MNHFRKAIIATVLICSFEFAYSQENYQPGYIVKLSKDTLRGFIDYRAWAISPKKISFKEKSSSDKIQFGPKDIRAFGVSDELYVGAIVKVEVDNPNVSKQQMELRTDAVFLQTIVRGSKSLYFCMPSQGRSHFYIKQDTTFNLLIYKRYTIENSSGSFESKNNWYYGQLQAYLENCPGITEEIKRLSYTKKDLENLFTSYFKKCTNTEISFQKKTEKTDVEFGMTAGPVLNAINFTGSVATNADYLKETKYKPTVGISTGLFVEFTFPRPQKRMSVQSELLYTYAKFNGTSTSYLDPATPDLYVTTTTDLAFSYLKLNNLLRYKYFVGNFQLFIDGGFSFGYMVGNKNNKTQTFSYSTNVQESIAIDDLRKTELSYLIGTGARMRKYSVEFRYEGGNGMSDYVNIKSATNRLHLLFCYRF